MANRRERSTHVHLLKLRPALALAIAGGAACYVPQDLCALGTEPGTYVATLVERYDATSRFTFDPGLVGSPPPSDTSCSDLDGLASGVTLVFDVSGPSKPHTSCRYFHGRLIDPRVVRKSDYTITHRGDKAMFAAWEVLQTSAGCAQDDLLTVFSSTGSASLGAPTPGQVPPVLLGRTIVNTDSCGGCTEYWVVELAKR